MRVRVCWGRSVLILSWTLRDCSRTQVYFIAIVSGILNNSIGHAWIPSIPNGKYHHQIPSALQKLKSSPHLPISTGVSLAWKHDSQHLRKERDLPIHLPCIFHRQEIWKGFKSQKFGYLYWSCHWHVAGACHLSILSNLPKEGSWKGACAITVEYGILK